jgi:hypothetical protein
MPFDLSLPAYAAFAIAGIAVLSRFGWPQLRLRTYNKVHGGLRVIEIALILSHAGAAGPRAFATVFAAGRMARRAIAAAFRRPAPGAAVPAAVQENMHERLLMEAQPEVKKAVPAAIDRAARGCAECVVYVTLKFGNS